ncbi:MAG: AAA family ATPase [Bacilli bacterium]|nr:AAA family ATPase [Bacilli bacterium]
MIKRDLYLQELINRKENSSVKIITGIRRSGKSFLLFEIYKEYLLKTAVSSDNNILID